MNHTRMLARNMVAWVYYLTKRDSVVKHSWLDVALEYVDVAVMPSEWLAWLRSVSNAASEASNRMRMNSLAWLRLYQRQMYVWYVLSGHYVWVDNVRIGVRLIVLQMTLNL